MLPPPSSNPFSVRSYARAFAVSGARSSVSGEVKGWWFETHLPSSSDQSNSGGSEYQQKRHSPCRDQAEPVGEVPAQSVERHVRPVGPVGHDQDQVAGCGAGRPAHALDLLGRQVLLDR